MTVEGVEQTGTSTRFEATILNVSMSGVLLEAAISANLWADKPLTIDLPGDVGRVAATVRRFLEYGEPESRTTRWGVELLDLTVAQRAQWARFVFSAARFADRGDGVGREAR